MSELYDLMIEKFGSAENFINQLCEKQGIGVDEQKEDFKQERAKCKTIDELIKDLKYWREVLGGDALVNIEDSSGYNSDVITCYDDHGTVIIG